MKKKLSLDEIKVQSFVTECESTKNQKGGVFNQDPFYVYTNLGGDCDPHNSFGTICYICPVYAN